MYFLPQEIEVWYLIPAIRSGIAKCFLKDFGYSYERVGKILGVSQAAISQYTKGKRAAKILLPKELSPKIKASCKILDKDSTKIVEELNKLLEHIRNKNLPFSVCSHLKENFLEDCHEIRFKDGNYRKVR